jgi:RNA polymerase sigma-70 factor (ECF subfamily)
LRFALAQDAAIKSEKASLSAIMTRLAIDRFRSVRVWKESYVGEWLPEPLLTGETHYATRDPEDLALLHQESEKRRNS